LPETDIDLLKRVAVKSGEIAMGFFQHDPEVWDKAEDAGPVTEADLAVNTYLMEELSRERSDYGWLSEETEDTEKRLQTKRQFVVDPIDGTRSFIDGSRDWAHSIAIVENGTPIAAVIAMPARELLYAATLGGGAQLNDEPISVRENRPLSDATVLTARPNLRPEFWENGKRPAFDTAFRSSLAYRMCLVAQGRFDAMITFRPSWEWDIAGGALIISEAGGKVVDRDGAPLVFNNVHPKTNGVLAGTPESINTLLMAMV